MKGKKCIKFSTVQSRSQRGHKPLFRAVDVVALDRKLNYALLRRRETIAALKNDK